LLDLVFQAIFTFCAYFIVDIVWVYYTLGIAKNNKLQASLSAAIIPVLVGIATIQFVDNPWMLIPAALGGFAGTWFSMKDD
jgi:hypothetical protein